MSTRLDGLACSYSDLLLCFVIYTGDMQTDVHDSVEDAMAAYELYQKAIELKTKGLWEQTLDELYAFGQKTDWKLGVESDVENE